MKFGSFEEMTDYRVAPGKIQSKPGTPCVKNEEVFKTERDMSIIEHESWLRGAPPYQIWDDLSIKKNNKF